MNHENLWTLGSELDDITFRLQAAARLVLLAQTSYIDGKSKPERRDFEALYSIYTQLEDLCTELGKLGESAFELCRADADHDGAADVLRALQEEYNAGKENRAPHQTPPSFSKPELAAIYTSACTAMYLYGRFHAEAEQK